jgi:hypothetical protein
MAIYQKNEAAGSCAADCANDPPSERPALCDQKCSNVGNCQCQGKLDGPKGWHVYSANTYHTRRRDDGDY